VLVLKVLHPNRVWITRGNHEFDEPSVPHSEFYEEISALYQCDVVRVMELFSWLPIAANSSDYAFAVHGGIPCELTDLSKLDDPRRPLAIVGGTMLEDLMRSDPDEQRARRAPRGIGNLSGIQVVSSFLERTGFSMIVRGHQSIQSGVHVSHEGKVVTVFSASLDAADARGCC
jgi:hypothetical protein